LDLEFFFSSKIFRKYTISNTLFGIIINDGGDRVGRERSNKNFYMKILLMFGSLFYYNEKFFIWQKENQYNERTNEKKLFHKNSYITL
jgi:hypothetical protein